MQKEIVPYKDTNLVLETIITYQRSRIDHVYMQWFCPSLCLTGAILYCAMIKMFPIYDSTDLEFEQKCYQSTSSAFDAF